MLCILIRSLKDSRSSQLGTLAAASACSCQNVWQQQQQQLQQSRNKITLPERSRDAQAGNCMQLCIKCHLRWRRGAPNWKAHWASRAEAEKKRRRRTEKAKLRAWTAEASDYYVSPEDIAARNNGDAQARAAVCQLHAAILHGTCPRSQGSCLTLCIIDRPAGKRGRLEPLVAHLPQPAKGPPAARCGCGM